MIETRSLLCARAFAVFSFFLELVLCVDGCRYLPARKSLSRKKRNNLRCKWLAETVNMRKADKESLVWQAIDKMREAASASSASTALAPSEPRFHAGQSVLQWWAGWMKSAKHPPKHYNKKNRPWWFSAEVLCDAGYGTVTYAGRQ